MNQRLRATTTWALLAGALSLFVLHGCSPKKSVPARADASAEARDTVAPPGPNQFSTTDGGIVEGSDVSLFVRKVA